MKPTVKTPRVLVLAKQQALQSGTTTHGSYDKGPWDKGHWTNRK